METVTIPLPLYQNVLTVLAQLPWQQVAQIMPELIKAAQESGHELNKKKK